jgi:large exoprotein involved in heme utilization and adhesion
LDGAGSNGGSGIGSAAFELASGNGGAIAINTDSLNVTNGATLLVSNFGAKDAGSVTINATGAVFFEGIGTNGYSSSAFSTVETGSNGNGGEIEITANSLTVNNGAVLGATTSGQGRGGDINLDVNTLQVQSGGQILTTSRGSGDAGDIFINTTENTIITGSDPTFPERLERIGRPIVRNEGAASGIFANTDTNSTGSGGNIDISARNLSISDDARINATNQGNTAIGATGGNVALKIADNLTLRDNGTISAQALENANGGNVNIEADFVIAFPNQNNDIIAAAAQGTGGNINIFTNALFGIEGRSTTPPNNTNDIDASSEFGLDGTVEINELDVNTVEGLEELPIEVIDVARLVEQNLCQQGEGSEFVVTGKGGIAPNPSQAREGEIDEVDLIEPATVGEPEGRGEQSIALTETDAESKMVEAQGWIVNDRGIVELVAHKTDLSGSSPQLNNTKVCHKY